MAAQQKLLKVLELHESMFHKQVDTWYKYLKQYGDLTGKHPITDKTCVPLRSFPVQGCSNVDQNLMSMTNSNNMALKDSRQIRKFLLLCEEAKTETDRIALLITLYNCLKNEEKNEELLERYVMTMLTENKEKECGFEIVWKWLREGADCLQEELCYLCLKVLRHSSKCPTEAELTSMQNSFTEVRVRNELKFWAGLEMKRQNKLARKERKEAEEEVEAEKAKIAAEKAKEETRASASVPDILGAVFAAPQPKAASKFKNLKGKEVLKPKALPPAIEMFSASTTKSQTSKLKLADDHGMELAVLREIKNNDQLNELQQHKERKNGVTARTARFTKGKEPSSKRQRQRYTHSVSGM